jgi:hypothetical protein
MGIAIAAATANAASVFSGLFLGLFMIQLLGHWTLRQRLVPEQVPVLIF